MQYSCFAKMPNVQFTSNSSKLSETHHIALVICNLTSLTQISDYLHILEGRAGVNMKSRNQHEEQEWTWRAWQCTSTHPQIPCPLDTFCVNTRLGNWNSPTVGIGHQGFYVNLDRNDSNKINVCQQDDATLLYLTSQSTANLSCPPSLHHVWMRQFVPSLLAIKNSFTRKVCRHIVPVDMAGRACAIDQPPQQLLLQRTHTHTQLKSQKYQMQLKSQLH